MPNRRHIGHYLIRTQSNIVMISPRILSVSVKKMCIETHDMRLCSLLFTNGNKNVHFQRAHIVIVNRFNLVGKFRPTHGIS